MGLAVAERFLAEGRIVVGIDRDAEGLGKAAASNGPAYHPVIADITDRTALSAALGPQLSSGAGAVVNAAGIYPATTLADYHEAVYRRIFDVNVRGTLNAVAPGWVDTPGTRAGGRIEQAVKTIPLGRAAQPQEIADWVWKLCHGTYMTGETLVISGGLTVR